MQRECKDNFFLMSKRRYSGKLGNMKEKHSNTRLMFSRKPRVDDSRKQFMQYMYMYCLNMFEETAGQESPEDVRLCQWD